VVDGFVVLPAIRNSWLAAFEQNVIKDPHRYAVQVSDTTLLLMVASLPGQQLVKLVYWLLVLPL